MDIERKAIAFILKSHKYNRRKTAKSLGISERSPQYKIKEYGLLSHPKIRIYMPGPAKYFKRPQCEIHARVF